MPIKVLSFAVGIGLFQQLSHLPDKRIFGMAFILLLIFGWRKQWGWCAFLTGWLWAALFAVWHLSYNVLPAALEGQELAVEGIIWSIPQQDERSSRFDFKVTQKTVSSIPNRLKLSWYHPKQSLYAGQHWALKVKLKRPHGLLNPGGFDYERWLFTQGVGATGYVRQPEQALLLGQDSPWQNITVLRQGIANSITHFKTLRYPGFIKALSIGSTTEITQSQWQVLRKTGTLHLIAISGSHISLVAGLVFWLVRRGWAHFGALRVSPQLVAAFSAILVAIFYALLAGFSVPTQRALVMLSVAMLGILGQRHVRPQQMLAIAVLLILFDDPLAVMSVGFQLSFAAVGLIFYMVSGRLKTPKYWVSTLKVNGIMALGLAPFMLAFFQQIPLIAPLANLIAVPIISFLVVPLALVAVLLLVCAPAIAETLLSVADFGLAKLWWLLEALANWPTVIYSGTTTSFSAILLACIGMLLLFMPKGLPGRSLSVILCLPLFYNAPKPLPQGSLKMTLLDVGQGLATVIQTADHILVFDTGIKFSAESDSGQSVLLPFLTQQGIQKLDGVVVSHGDNDHIGGTAALLARFTPDWLYTSVPQQLQAYAAKPCLQGQHWVWDAVEFTLLSPPSTGFLSENDNSCVLHVKAANGAILLTGDIEQTAENWLVETYGQALHANVLVAPHHGSKTSSSEAFLQAVAPESILIPSGYRNPFHFPHPTVLKRYQAQQIKWLSTAEQGAIRVDIAATGIKVTPYRFEVGKYWQAQLEP